jgi:hypothetical protein
MATRVNRFLMFIVALSVFGAMRILSPEIKAENMQVMQEDGDGDSQFALEVRLRSDKPVYKMGETISLQVSLLNRSEQPIYLYGILDWGLSASLSLRVMDQGNKEIPRKFLDDALTPPPSDLSSFFVPLFPDHFFGTTRNLSLAESNINKPGKYKIVVEYHSPIPKNLSPKLSIWEKENGTMGSKPLEIEVVRE